MLAGFQGAVSSVSSLWEPAGSAAVGLGGRVSPWSHLERQEGMADVSYFKLFASPSFLTASPLLARYFHPREGRWKKGREGKFLESCLREKVENSTVTKEELKGPPHRPEAGCLCSRLAGCLCPTPHPEAGPIPFPLEPRRTL